MHRLMRLAMTAMTATALLATLPGIASAAERLTSVGAISFKSAPFEARDVPREWRPYYSPTLAPTTQPTDSVSMRVIDGVAYDFALRQAHSGRAYLTSYELTGNPYYLLKAKAHADHLIAKAYRQGDAWFYLNDFPYSFDRRYGGALTPPWYSGIAQGAAIAFFSQLWEVTGDPVYRDAADHTLLSFLVPQGSGKAWISRTDSLRYLGIEEYPGTKWTYVYNGHLEAALGLYEYYRVTRDDRALELYRGALTSALRYGDHIRMPGWASAYSLGVRAQYVGYHSTHIRQLLYLWTLTGDVRFAQLGNRYYQDYPFSRAGGRVRLGVGTYTAYRFSTSGRLLGTRTLKVRTPKSVRIKGRAPIRNRPGRWLAIDGTAYKGYVLKEVPGRVAMLGVVDAIEFRPPLPVTQRAGTWKVVSMDGSGTVTGVRSVTTTAGPAAISTRASIGGVPSGLLSTGPAEGSWIPLTALVLP